MAARVLGNVLLACLYLTYNLPLMKADRNEKLTNNVKYWTQVWINSTIPYCFDYFTEHTQRLFDLVYAGIAYLEARSCLVFKEYRPEVLADMNVAYLYYSFTNVMENCCVPYISKLNGKRIVLITPMCSENYSVAHTTLHAIGFMHERRKPFVEHDVVEFLFPVGCPPNQAQRKYWEEPAALFRKQLQ